MKIEYLNLTPKLNYISGETWLNGEDYVAEFMKTISPCKTVFSVGAQKDFGFCSIFSNSDIHLFEPNKIAYKELIDSPLISDNKRIRVNPFGMASKEGEATYYYQGESIYNHCGVNDEKDTIVLSTLEKYMAENGIGSVDFLKIDIEGQECDALIGAGTRLNDIEFIQFEYGDRWPKAGKCLKDMYNLLKGRFIYHIEERTLRYHPVPLEHFSYANYLASKIKL